MPLIQLLEVLIVVGVLLWLVNRFIPMQSSIKSILNGVVVIAVVLWLLNVFGLFHSLIRHPHRKRVTNWQEILRNTSSQQLDRDNVTRQASAKGIQMKMKLLLAAGIALSVSALAQTNQQSAVAVEPMAQTPTFRVVVTSRTTPAVNYRHHSGPTKVDLMGTNLMPSANGEAEVNSKRGTMEIKAEFGNLQKPTTFGNEYLTYILWAISPEGRAVNLGEVLVGGNDRSKLHVTTDLQAFALIVTAEPYYAVRQPSNVVVLENVIRKDTKGNHRDGGCEVRAHGAGRLHSDRLQVRPRGPECQVAVGIL